MTFADLAILALGSFSAGTALGVATADPWLRPRQSLRTTMNAAASERLTEQMGLLTVAITARGHALEEQMRRGQEAVLQLAEEVRDLRDELARSGVRR